METYSRIEHRRYGMYIKVTNPDTFNSLQATEGWKMYLLAPSGLRWKLETTLETSGEDVNYTRSEWRRCKLHSKRVEKMQNQVGWVLWARAHERRRLGIIYALQSSK